MTARRTERALPFGFTPADLGHHAVEGDLVVVGFNANPAAVTRPQRFVCFVTADALAQQIDHFDWSANSAAAISTASGFFELSPDETGPLSVTVTARSSTGQDLGSVSLDYDIVALNETLESLLTQSDEPGPVAGHPGASREVVNDIRAFIDELAPRDADPDSSLNRLLFAIAYAEAIRRTGSDRSRELEEIADALDADDPTAFAARAATGIGTCRIRPQILAMYTNAVGGADPLVPKTLLPAEPEQRATADRQLLEALTTLDAAHQRDLFNAVRFPKSSLLMMIRLIDGIRDDLHPGTSTRDVLGDKAAAVDFFDHLSVGPVVSA